MDKSRRNILKLLAFGSGAFVLGKLIGPSIDVFNDGVLGKEGERVFTNFRLVEKNNELSLFDQKGEEIVVVELEK